MFRSRYLVPLGRGAHYASRWAVGISYRRSLASSSSDIRPALSYCVDLVRKHDYENYFWMAQLPKEHRTAVFVIRAFNVETAMVADHVAHSAKKGQKILGQMRFQWWRDALNAAYRQQAPEHPVATALQHVLATGSGGGEGGGLLTRYRFQQVVDAREADFLETHPPSSLAGLQEYAAGTSVQILTLQMEAAGSYDAAAQEAARHIGLGVGLATLLRGTVLHASQGRVYLPVGPCARRGVSQHDVLDGRSSDGLRAVAEELAQVCEDHLQQGRALRQQLPVAARRMMLPAVGAGLYLQALRGKTFNLLDTGLITGGFSPLWLQLQQKAALVTGRY